MHRFRRRFDRKNDRRGPRNVSCHFDPDDVFGRRLFPDRFSATLVIRLYSIFTARPASSDDSNYRSGSRFAFYKSSQYWNSFSLDSRRPRLLYLAFQTGWRIICWTKKVAGILLNEAPVEWAKRMNRLARAAESETMFPLLYIFILTILLFSLPEFFGFVF